MIYFRYNISTMAMWADNLKFVKDIIDTKYNKIEVAVAEVTLEEAFLRYSNFSSSSDDGRYGNCGQRPCL